MGISKLKDRVYSKFNASNYSDTSSTATSSSTPYDTAPTYPYDPYNTQYQQYQQAYQYQTPPPFYQDRNAHTYQGAYPVSYPPNQMVQTPYNGYAQPYAPANPDQTPALSQVLLENQLPADNNAEHQQPSDYVSLPTPERSGTPPPASTIEIIPATMSIGTVPVDATTSGATRTVDLPTYKSTQDEKMSMREKVLEKKLGVANAEKIDKMTAEERREHVKKYLRDDRSKGYYRMFAGF